MTPAEITDRDIATLAKDLRDQGEPFAIATVIRTVGATAAKPGAKAVLLMDGSIARGWIGGGCVRASLARAARQAFADRQPQLVSLHPEDVLEDKGIEAGSSAEGISYGRNGCPSKGSMDIFVEPILPQPELRIFGASPVAQALAELAARFQWATVPMETGSAMPRLSQGGRRMIVVATQGKDDLACLCAAVNAQAEFVAFVGSRRKFETLSDRLRQQGVDAALIDTVVAPAGLHIDAVTPDEIALSILAQLTQKRRRNQRDGSNDV